MIRKSLARNCLQKNVISQPLLWEWFFPFSSMHKFARNRCDCGHPICIHLVESQPWNSRMPLGATPEAQNGRRVLLEPAQEPRHARKVVFEVTTVRCVRFLRSQWPLGLLFVCYRHQLLRGSTLHCACYAHGHTIYLYI